MADVATQRAHAQGRTADVSSASHVERVGSGPSWKYARGEPIACTASKATRVIGVSPRRSDRCAMMRCARCSPPGETSESTRALTLVGGRPANGRAASTRPTRSAPVCSPPPRRRYCARAAAGPHAPTVGTRWAVPRAFACHDDRSGAVGQEHAQIHIPLFADGAEAPAVTRWSPPSASARESWRTARPEAKASDIADERDQRGRGQQADARDGLQERHVVNASRGSRAAGRPSRMFSSSCRSRHTPPPASVCSTGHGTRDRLEQSART